MFQSFDAPDAAATQGRVPALRAAMAKAGLDAVLVPRADQHQGEYVPACAERLAWLTGFTGSAGQAIVARTRAVLLVDGRYTTQAPAQVDTGLFEIAQVPQASAADWLAGALPKGGVVGFDPWLHTIGEVERLKAALAPKGIKLKPTRRNLVDRVWGAERPAPPRHPVEAHPVRLAELTVAEKLALVREALAKDGQDAVVLTLPDSVCWLFNIRGRDVAHNPVVLAFAVVRAKGKALLFLDRDRLGAEAREGLGDEVRLIAPGELEDKLADLGRDGARVRVDPATAAWRIQEIIGAKRIARGGDPCLMPKARKVTAEVRGMRAAHKRDGVAVCQFLAWLDRTAPGGGVDEITTVRELEARRARSNLLREISFDTISGSGPNGAIVHYRVTTATNRRLRPGELFLIDSGGQYADGTTDITRTIAIGTPSQEMRERYTAVLRGHLAISMAKFPVGTRGIDLDPLARQFLWQQGVDYDHGTGHGVGSYLSVHEGPQSISKRGMVALEPGMICSNEPGYYKPGAYGIRIENLVLVTKAAVPEGGDRAMMAFETLTLAPYDRRLIVADQLTAAERAFVDAYHARVLAEMGPKLDATDRAWLEAACAPL